MIGNKLLAFSIPTRLIAFITVALVLSLGSLGLVDDSWSHACSADGTFCTCHPDVKFVKAFTNDDGVVNSSKKDPNDNGIDPGYDKDVANCIAEVQGSDKVLITITNAYPSYTCRFWTKIRNLGKITLHCEASVINASPELTVIAVDTQQCDMLYPNKTEVEEFTVHIEQPAQQGGSYQFSIEKKFTEVKKKPCWTWPGCW
jgi:hypothetical protein